jgi:hypothetical protein
LLREHRPDMLWIDPVFSYLGGNASSQEDVSPFLRNQINPLVREFDCGVVLVHHTNKPPSGKEKSSWAGADLAYVGSGSSEFANWSRGVLAMRSIGAHDVYELRAAKRGSRLGWTNDAGERCFEKLIAHSRETGAICWREVDSKEIPRPGRPRSSETDDVLALLPRSGLGCAEWKSKAGEELGISTRTFYRAKRELADSGRAAQSSTSGRWQPVSKKGLS